MGSCGVALMLALIAMVLIAAAGQGVVPGVIIFGDSAVDAGNNNHLYTLVKANFPPYGHDFVQHAPTGRFCNGKLASDFTVENLGFSTYPPPYLSKEAAGKNLLNGTNFASGASGYLESTANLYHAISLRQQLEYYREYQENMVRLVGKNNATAFFNGSVHLMSFGTSDYLQNYYINPLLYRVFTADQFADILVKSFAFFVQKLYKMGARRIGVTSLPPLGCLPASITLFGEGNNTCVERLNKDAVAFNNKLNATATRIKRRQSDLKLVVLDIYTPVRDLVKNPESNARKACCGTGTIETSLLCNTHSPGTCANATGYVFWDSFHPSEATNKVLSDALLTQGIDLIS